MCDENHKIFETKRFFLSSATKNWTKLFLTAPRAKHFFLFRVGSKSADVALLFYFLIEARCWCQLQPMIKYNIVLSE